MMFKEKSLSKEKIGDRRIVDVIVDIVDKICFLKNSKSKDKEARREYKIYNPEIEQFLKRSYDVTELKKGKVWNVVPPETVSSRSWVDDVEASVQEFLKNKC